MKIITLVFASVMAATALVRSQEPGAAEVSQSTTVVANGHMAGGEAAPAVQVILPATPPDFVPPAPKPPLAPVEAIQRSSVQQGGRTVTMERIAAPEIPAPPAAPAASSLTPEERALRRAAFLALRRQHPQVFLCLSATVYDHKATLLRWRHGEAQYKVWSNIDFNHIRGLDRFDAGGVTYNLLMMVGDAYTAPRTLRGRVVRMAVPEIPPLPEEPGFVVVEGDPTDGAAMEGIREIHELYRQRRAELVAAYEQRLRYQAQAQAWEKAHPKQPEDVTIRWWRGKREPAVQTDALPAPQADTRPAPPTEGAVP